MRVTSSLTNRIFLACTLLATVPLGVAFYLVNARAASEVAAELRRNLAETALLVDERWATLTGTYTTFARLIADLPKLKAAVETGDPPTVQPLANEYRRQIGADVLIVTAPGGRVLAASGAGAGELPGLPSSGPPEEERSAFVAHPRGLLQVVSVPMVVLGGEPIQVLGRLTVGFFFDDQVAGQFKRLTGSEVAFVAAGRVLATSLPRTEGASLAALPAIPSGVVTATRIGVEDFVVERRPLHGTGGATGASEPDALILRSGTEQLRFLNTLRTGLAGALIATVLLATVLSYAVARTMTRPLAAVTSAMSDVSITGDLSRKVAVRSRTWDDEDARLLGTAFNTLTESIARFQREAAQRERLSSLGRLSTVIAHEIRNPLMIIRASLPSLRGDASPEERREAVADIDEETRRINRTISEVLDFAKPIRFDFAEADANEICRASTAAAWAGDPSDDVRLDLDVSLPPVVTDAERLRTALVNMLVNARHALAARAEAGDGAGRTTAVAVADEPGIIVTTRRQGDHVVITIGDHGVGIPPEDLAHIFDPYYTTRRAGTGLGLPIAKTIIEGLGGTISVSSRIGEGTHIQVDLPRVAPGARA